MLLGGGMTVNTKQHIQLFFLQLIHSLLTSSPNWQKVVQMFQSTYLVSMWLNTSMYVWLDNSEIFDIVIFDLQGILVFSNTRTQWLSLLSFKSIYEFILNDHVISKDTKILPCPFQEVPSAIFAHFPDLHQSLHSLLQNWKMSSFHLLHPCLLTLYPDGAIEY